MSTKRRAMAFFLFCACASSPKPAPSTPAAAASHEHAAASWTLQGLAKGAVLLPDLGAYKRPISTSSRDAQAFFDQGLALTYGFNHDEAARSYARAAELDPSCALCFWGVAYTLGPNYNMPMLAERAHAAWDAITRAQAIQATPVEKALIQALAKRYKGPEYVAPEAMAAYNQAYADAMREVARGFPEDLDAQTLYAEALMNVNPWKLWNADGTAARATDEIVATLEGVLAKAADHPGANHFYIHAVEASKTPARALKSAERLAGLMPGAGHVVHMPAHIFQRVGRYADASRANEQAVVVDDQYIKTVKPLGYYPFYLAHNHGFLAYSAAMEGRGALALEAARKSANAMPRELVCGMPGMDFFLSEPLLVMVRFGRFDALLSEPEPDAKAPVLRALYHHARGMALAATGKTEDARAQLSALVSISTSIQQDMLAGLNAGSLVLDLAAKVLAARIADVTQDPTAIAQWQAAVALEDQLAYNEPADWFYPVRHYLGAAQLTAAKAKDAEATYREDLAKHPDNGWGLYGLWQALLAQKHPAAKQAEQDFRSVWKNADIELTRSAF